MNSQNINQRFCKTFPGDPSGDPYQRQTPGLLWASVSAAHFENVELICFNSELSEQLGLGQIEDDLDFLATQRIPSNVNTYATAYAGHQFGSWAGQLGDGRALYAGEIVNEVGERHELQWKGAGATPYSRSGDGRAVLRSSVREFLMSEAMYHLRVPTTRAVSLVKTGERVVRDIAYDGNPRKEEGAVVLRSAESFLRFGHFELLAARQEYDTLQKLIDYCIVGYFDEVSMDSSTKNLDFFEAVAHRTAVMIVEWYRVGFVHGVMNTDNMSIVGVTIDYGPFSMLDEYDLEFTPNTTDLPGRRYAYGKQGQIAHWNLMQLANSLYPLIKDEKALQDILDHYAQSFWDLHDTMLCKKFGFDTLLPDDSLFFTNWQQIMQDLKLDHTLFFTTLTECVGKGLEGCCDEFKVCFYHDPSNEELMRLQGFLEQYSDRLKKNTFSLIDSQQVMKENNPQFVLRNYLLYEAIEELENGNNEFFLQLWNVLKSPYSTPGKEWIEKRPKKYDWVYGCSQLSCSS